MMKDVQPVKRSWINGDVDVQRWRPGLMMSRTDVDVGIQRGVGGWFNDETQVSYASGSVTLTLGTDVQPGDETQRE